MSVYENAKRKRVTATYWKKQLTKELLKPKRRTIKDRMYWNFCPKKANIENSSMTKGVVFSPILMVGNNRLIRMIFSVKGLITVPACPFSAPVILKTKERKA